ncbi:MAG: zinc ribbon domain-containing protein [Deltaproteobacteria bacterium]|jgi:predicted amidophosphoribosyltransferase|nr:zinc ribbon domain-containing protein [Deltaproteobacteria bacterium]
MELLCDECGAPLLADNCSNCQNPVPLWAKFCPHCGQGMTKIRTKSETKAKRQLCSDESCVGIIGPDGLCTDCGKRPL